LSVSRMFLLAVMLFLILLTPAASAQDVTRAQAELKNGTGQTVGTATLTQESSGVRITVELSNFPAGRHGVHIHAVGMCEPANFTSAGAHFNPEGKKHGLQNPEGPHAGDLPNLEVGSDGTGSLEYLNSRVTLSVGPSSLFDADGSALVIHANPDDEKSDPTGNSGGRIACGVLLAVPPPTFLEQYWLTISVVIVVLVLLASVFAATRRRKRT